MRSEDKAAAGAKIHAAYETDRAAVDQKVIDQIAKLFKLASNNTNENERDAALAKAQKLMDEHNLSEAAITEGASSAKAAKRVDEKRKGGLYNYQRDLWKAMAELNFCFYFHTNEFDKNKLSKYWVRKYGSVAEARKWGRIGGYVPKHRLVGRAVNVAATLAMAGYIEQAIERLVKERIQTRVVEKARAAEERAERWGYAVDTVKEDPLWGEWAVKYREGIADTVISKLQKRRREIISEQKKQTIHVPEDTGQGRTGTALTLMDVQEQEHAANYDFLHGDGAYARLLERRAQYAAERAREEAEYAAWAAANPEEAKAEEEKRRKAARRVPWNYGMSSKGDKTDHGAYWDGRDAGKNVSIDPQMATKTAGLLK